MTDVNLVAIKVNRCDQPVFVAANVEDDPLVNFIGGGERGAQFGEILEIGFLHDFEPALEGGLAVRVFVPELDQRFACDDVHGGSISQFEIDGKWKWMKNATNPSIPSTNGVTMVNRGAPRSETFVRIAPSLP